ncbi:MAG: hypothetical protein ABI702_16475 [Burkholderiales bacterium]
MKNKNLRQARNDSAESIAQAFLDKALGPVKVPTCITLDKTSDPYYQDIVSSRPRGMWSKPELILAADCAKVMFELSIVLGLPYSKVNDKRRGELIRLECRMLRDLKVIGWRVRKLPVLPDVPDDDLIAQP